MKLLPGIFWAFAVTLPAHAADKCGQIDFGHHHRSGEVRPQDIIKKCTTAKNVSVTFGTNSTGVKDICEIDAGQPIGAFNCRGECSSYGFCFDYYWTCDVKVRNALWPGEEPKTGKYYVAKMERDPLNPHFTEAPAISNCQSEYEPPQ